ncbi:MULTISPECIES: rhamnogalacturonan lyase family protein [unclassified Paenibacillus]|uniref:rhamnogalacturonan lyase family protein n=1 Tax=unclassified Paenibacillus TaxID=185978 RepID=UPI003636A373
MITVLHDRFNQFSIGPFPYDPKHSAIGEYHYYPSEGNKGGWYDPVVYYGWLGPTWIVTEDAGVKYMEQTRPQAAITAHWPLLVKGDESWSDYTMEATVRPLSTGSHVGILFRYQHGRRYYFLGFEKGRLILLKRDQQHITELASIPFAYNSDTCYRLKVACNGAELTASVDGKVLLLVEDASYENGKIGLSSRMPAQYSDIVITMTEQQHADWMTAVNVTSLKLAQLRSEYPQPRLWKTIDFKNFGTARQIRFGHLKGGNELQLVLAQHQKRGHKDAYAHISCLTAITLEGEVLWQLGEPSTLTDHLLLSADLPFQVCDIDGDGFDEVIVARNFRLQILDGRTGEVKRSIPTPLSSESTGELFSVPFNEYAFDRINVDMIRIANFSGKQTPTDIVIKDRYSRVWAYTNELEPLWSFHEGITGHFPYTADVNGDGKDEMFVGYHLVDHDGKLIFTLPVETDHTDEILIGHWDPTRKEPLIAIASGEEGFMIADLQGNLVHKHMIGHAQRVSVGNYRPELEGLELCVSTFWGEQGIVYFFDGEGRLLHQFEPTCNGNVITPVNWTGDGNDLVLLNGNTQHGGLIDGHGRRVVIFPEDGHPDLCAEVLDLTGDGRDEIMLWDSQRMYIYTQDRAATHSPVAVPSKYPLYNASNYRGEYHYPKS